MNIPILAAQIVSRVHKSPDSVTNLETLVAALIREELERGKKRVVFQFDERSLESREDFKAAASANGWKLIEVETVNGTVLIPDCK